MQHPYATVNSSFDRPGARHVVDEGSLQTIGEGFVEQGDQQEIWWSTDEAVGRVRQGGNGKAIGGWRGEIQLCSTMPFKFRALCPPPTRPLCPAAHCLASDQAAPDCTSLSTTRCSPPRRRHPRAESCPLPCRQPRQLTPRIQGDTHIRLSPPHARRKTPAPQEHGSWPPQAAVFD